MKSKPYNDEWKNWAWEANLKEVCKMRHFFCQEVSIYIYINLYIWSPTQDLPISFFNGIYSIKCLFCKSKK